MKPTLGRIVLFVISQTDANLINANRQKLNARAATVSGGQVFPAIVVKTWETNAVNLKVFLDGEDNHWVHSRAESKDLAPGTWHWPPRVDAPTAVAPAPEGQPTIPPSVGDWDADAAVFRAADGTVIQPETDAERGRRGLAPYAEKSAEVPSEPSSPQNPGEGEPIAPPFNGAQQSSADAPEAPPAPGQDQTTEASNSTPEQ